MGELLNFGGVNDAEQLQRNMFSLDIFQTQNSILGKFWPCVPRARRAAAWGSVCFGPKTGYMSGPLLGGSPQLVSD